MINIDTHTGPSFSLSNRILRSVWGVAYVLLFRYTPRPFHGWRILILRLFSAKVGKGVHVYPKVQIWAPWNIDLGDQCGIGNGVNLYSQDKITIGTKTVISQGVQICTGTHDYTQSGFPLYTKSITIGNNVWVASEAFIHPGVRIGNGAVVGARSVVTKNIPEWMVCSGNPCKPIKERILK